MTPAAQTAVALRERDASYFASLRSSMARRSATHSPATTSMGRRSRMRHSSRNWSRCSGVSRTGTRGGGCLACSGSPCACFRFAMTGDASTAVLMPQLYNARTYLRTINRKKHLTAAELYGYTFVRLYGLQQL
jgi:hypothetical protein